MKNIVVISLTLLVFSGCSSLSSSHPADAYKYKKDLTSLRTYLIQKNVDMQRVEQEALSLMDQAIPLLKSFAAKYPDCQELIQVIIDEREKMLQMKLSEIERVYHEGEGLPESDLRCYNPKEMVVHPATVYLLTQTDNVEKPLMSMRAELDELDLHFDLFREDLQRK